jgi:hypothetical protein
MLITALAWAITAGIALVLPLAWMQWPRSPWAMAWIVTALFAVMEMWQAEYRLGLSRAWEVAYWRDIESLQRQPSETIQSSQSRFQFFGDDAAFHPLSNQAALGLLVPSASCDGLSNELSQSSHNTRAVASSSFCRALQPSIRCISARIPFQLPREVNLPDGAWNYHTQPEATPVARCCCYMVMAIRDGRRP